jgi:L-rhamnose mutarotase
MTTLKKTKTSIKMEVDFITKSGYWRRRKRPTQETTHNRKLPHTMASQRWGKLIRNILPTPRQMPKNQRGHTYMHDIFHPWLL